MYINRIVKNAFPSYKILGLSPAEIQNRYLSINDIDSVAEAVCDETTIVIYDDTPLLNEELLSLLAERCVAENDGFALGNGFIVKTGFQGKPKPLNLVETTVFSPDKLSFFVDAFRKKIIRSHKNNGVVFTDENTVFIDFDVKICSLSTICPFVTLSGNTYIGKNTTIKEHSVVCDSNVGDRCSIRSCTIEDSIIGDDTTVGPYAYVRNASLIGNHCRVGDFVEIKNSFLSDNVKVAHLAYIGDAEVGENTNVGCGTVFCNYDGRKKHRTLVGKNVFIGANANLVAPLCIGDGAFIAAGSTVTRNVENGAFVIARSRQITKSFTR